MNTKEMISVLEAFDRGEKIQSTYLIMGRCTNEPQWCDEHNPTWDFEHRFYRVAPKHVTRDWYIAQDWVSISATPNFRITFNDAGDPIKGEPI